MTDNGYLLSHKNVSLKPLEVRAPNTSVEQHFLVIKSGTGKDLLTLDISESGVELQYDSADLPEILKATEFCRTLKGGLRA